WRKMFSPINEKNSTWTSYARSKLAITMLACHLNRIKGVRAVSVDPGAVNTSMTEAIAPRMRKLLRKIGIKSALINADEAAEAVVIAANEEQPANTYRKGRKYSKLWPFVLSAQNGIELEKLSRKMIESAFAGRNNL
uniref:Short-chain dehydrogenase n=1 Tax=Parascaris univalens TaxID=6257 RepID=A0A915A8Y7_PARUN